MEQGISYEPLNSALTGLCEGNRVFRLTVFPPGGTPGSTAGETPATTTEELPAYHAWFMGGQQVRPEQGTFQEPAKVAAGVC